MSKPTVKQLYDSVLNDLESEFQINIPLFGKSFLRALAGVQAAKLWLIYLLIGKLQKNIFVDTADPERSGGTLERFGRVKLGRNPTPARSGEYTVQLNGQIGATVSAQTTFKSDDNSAAPGYLFIIDTAHTLITETDTITVRALTAGLDAALQVGDTLTATAPIANVDSGVEVTEITLEARAAEDIEAYRRQTELAFRLEPQGGAATDYRLWSLDAAGVRTSYPFTEVGEPNNINLFVEATAEDSTDGRGTPSAALLDEVQEVVERDPDDTKQDLARGRQPLGAWEVNYEAVTPIAINIEISGYTNRTAELEAAIETAITDRLFNTRPFVAGIDVEADRQDIIDNNAIIFEIKNLHVASNFTDVSFTVNATPETSYQFENGEIPYLNSITYF